LSIRKINIKVFLEMASYIPVVDVRSPSEYDTGHIPGAYSIPLFNDNEREAVGIKYKKEGRTKAILKGLELSGPEISMKLEKALKLSQNRKLLLYCWRGGMRSEAMAWLFSLGDLEVEILDGGYKSYRNHVLEQLSDKTKMIVLGGMTGSGKTQILKYLKNANNQVIDLEDLANHKGSAFGSLGQPAQPSSEYFANLLFNEWIKIDRNHPVWVEDESRNIGTVFIPDQFYLNIQDSPVIALLMDVKTRMPRLIEEYSTYSSEDLKKSIIKISKRMGGDNAKEAITAVEKGNFEKAIELTLNYYDKTYLFGLRKKRKGNIYHIQTNTDDIESNATKILDVACKIIW
jgi:tRNA 2-selenouridine synthase